MKIPSLLFILLVACSRGPEVKKDIGVAGGDTGIDFDCDSQGDDCIEQACEACVESCGADCSVQESYPPQYSCPDGSWTVYDFCPDWEFTDSGE